MNITYCANMDRGVFATVTGHGVPKGMVRLWAPDHARDEELMTSEEARRIGIEEGYLVEFRETDSFYGLCRHFLRYDPAAFDELCLREELDPATIRARLK